MYFQFAPCKCTVTLCLRLCSISCTVDCTAAVQAAYRQQGKDIWWPPGEVSNKRRMLLETSRYRAYPSQAPTVPRVETPRQEPTTQYTTGTAVAKRPRKRNYDLVSHAGPRLDTKSSFSAIHPFPAGWWELFDQGQGEEKEAGHTRVGRLTVRKAMAMPYKVYKLNEFIPNPRFQDAQCPSRCPASCPCRPHMSLATLQAQQR